MVAAPGETVTSAATECGFFHLGHFSMSYRRHFGELPSETLRRSRDRASPVLTGGRTPKRSFRSSDRAEGNAAS